MTKKLLLLHGNRQTGQLLLSRMDKLRKRLQKELEMEIVAPDAPFAHSEEKMMRTWWNREGDSYQGLDQSMNELKQLWNQGSFCGILGFSQGARMAHLISIYHSHVRSAFHGLQFVIMVSGYEAPLPPEMREICVGTKEDLPTISIPSLHIFGVTDKLIPPDISRAVMEHYDSPEAYEHEGGHHVPMRADSVRTFLDFIQQSLRHHSPNYAPNVASLSLVPDPETALMQQEEVEAISAIFPDEFRLLSAYSQNSGCYSHPIKYQIDLNATDRKLWPPRPVSLQFEYPHNYPQESIPIMRLIHDNNMMQFSSAASEACLKAMESAAIAEEGMPCVLSCVYAARDFFDSGGIASLGAVAADFHANDADETVLPEVNGCESTPCPSTIKAASVERIRQCNEQGLKIAEILLKSIGLSEGTESTGKGGSWTYTIGLVGKPSAGKSTFFNAATAFARQRKDSDNLLGGATMAPHPFTTIDPNIGAALVPAPDGSCPEDDYKGSDYIIGSTHGRDNMGRRFIPILLKDVAGLVPGAYLGRGRGNKFLNDLTDADVLLHVLDASGMADTEGNALVVNQDETAESELTNPLNDLSWIRNELIEWVYTNLMFKWDTIKRKGRSKLSDMFSGYGQPLSMTLSVLNAIEKYMEDFESRDNPLDNLHEWDQGDIYRLISAFLGLRFPMALAMNKCDIPSSVKHVQSILKALPIDGAHVGVPLSAHSEMLFIRKHILEALNTMTDVKEKDDCPADVGAFGVWRCLQMAVSLRKPILVFPVCDFKSYMPLPGLTKYATGDASLPSAGMIACIETAGGCKPSLWDSDQNIYTNSKTTIKEVSLRDVLVMKPGSTVEDVFMALKRIGALSGEFVRAEAAGEIGTPSRPVPKSQRISKENRILKIMTNKRIT